jgi:hypothetical protein
MSLVFCNNTSELNLINIYTGVNTGWKKFFVYHREFETSVILSRIRITILGYLM